MAARRTAGTTAARRTGTAFALFALVVVGVLVAALLLRPGADPDPGGGEDAGSGPGGGADGSSPTADPAALDVSGLPIQRAAFCPRIDDDAVTTALGTPAEDLDDYGNGDRTELVAGTVDVSHEFGCTFTAGDATARSWVFAAPLTGPEADAVLREDRRRAGCRFTDRVGYGDPSLTSVCAVELPASPGGTGSPDAVDSPGSPGASGSPDGSGDRRATEVRLRGLFGDSWLSCELTLPRVQASPATTRDRAETWCVHVAMTLGARP